MAVSVCVSEPITYQIWGLVCFVFAAGFVCPGLGGEHLVDRGGGGGSSGPSFEQVRVGALGDPGADLIGDSDAARGEDCEQDPRRAVGSAQPLAQFHTLLFLLLVEAI